MTTHHDRERYRLYVQGARYEGWYADRYDPTDGCNGTYGTALAFTRKREARAAVNELNDAFQAGIRWANQHPLPADWPVQPVEIPEGWSDTIVACRVCGRAWDDTVSTQRTPVPAGRCPFEEYHPPVDDRS